MFPSWAASRSICDHVADLPLPSNDATLRKGLTGEGIMHRSKMLGALRRLVHAARISRDSGASWQELVQRRPGRREILKGAAAAAVLAGARSALGATKPAPRIAIVGGGIAGLNAALTLQDAGIA